MRLKEMIKRIDWKIVGTIVILYFLVTSYKERQKEIETFTTQSFTEDGTTK